MEENGKYASSVIAEYFLQKEKGMKNDIMKVLKLVYISHGFHLAFYDIPLIKENVQAWQYGPVIPELYFRLKTNDLNDSSFFQDKQDFEKDATTKKLLDAVYKKYSKYNGIELSNLTHRKDTPWDITVNQYGSVITNKLTKSYYKKLIGNG